MSAYQQIFNYLAQEHNALLLESELHHIIDLAAQYAKERDWTIPPPAPLVKLTEEDLSGYRVHELKTHRSVFSLVKIGLKKFEIRRNDRDFKINDLLKLYEYDREKGCYVEDSPPILCRVSYVMDGGEYGIEHGFVALGLENVSILTD